MEVIKGDFGKKKDEVMTVEETFQKLLDAENIATFEKCFGIAFRHEDGLTVFASNIDDCEMYVVCDQIKDYLRGNYS